MKIIRKPMLRQQCHRNVAVLYARGEIDSIVDGYAFNGYKWLEHTWGLKDKNIIETTVRFKDYDGVILNEADTRLFLFNELWFSNFKRDRKIWLSWARR